jgi:ABC-type transport system substrate-binding protein
MRRIAYQYRAATSCAGVGTGIPARPSRAKLGYRRRVPHVSRFSRRRIVFFLASVVFLFATTAHAETRPHYGGTLRIMMQAAPATLDLPANPVPSDYWETARTLSLIGDTLVTLDSQARPQPALALTWQSDPGDRRWQFRLRHGVKFHDGSPASSAAIAQILGALHPNWSVHSSADSISIESETPMPSLPAELALPRNLLLKRNANHWPVGTGPFVVADWQPGKLLKLAANEENWAGRPFVDAIEIEFGKSLRDQSIALELDKTDIIEIAPQASTTLQRRSAASSSSSMSLPVELLALVFSPGSKAQDPRLREALALALDRKPIQSVLLKGAGEPAASILPNWMTGYSAVFSTQADPQRARLVLAGSRPPALNLSYDPRDPQAQLIAERIALNAREAGITVQVSLSGVADIRLIRAVLPSSDPTTSLAEAARQLGLPQPALATYPNSLDDLYRSESALLDGCSVIPLFHLPVASGASPRVRAWEPGQLGLWNESGRSLADVWLADPRFEAGSR